MRLLIIRPKDAALQSASLARGAGMTADVMPLFEICPLRWSPPDPHAFDGLLITSVNALRYAGDRLQHLRDLPVLAVGAASAAAAREHGFAAAMVGSAGKEALLAQAGRKGFSRLLWLAGKHRTAAAPDEDLIAERITVYEARELPAPEGFDAQLGQCDAVMLHSPRAARHFAQIADLSDVPRSQISLAALSPAVAQAAGPGWRFLAVANAPNDEAMLLAAQSIAKQGP